MIKATSLLVLTVGKVSKSSWLIGCKTVVSLWLDPVSNSSKIAVFKIASGSSSDSDLAKRVE